MCVIDKCVLLINVMLLINVCYWLIVCISGSMIAPTFAFHETELNFGDIAYGNS